MRKCCLQLNKTLCFAYFLNERLDSLHFWYIQLTIWTLLPLLQPSIRFKYFLSIMKFSNCNLQWGFLFSKFWPSLQVGTPGYRAPELCLAHDNTLLPLIYGPWAAYSVRWCSAGLFLLARPTLVSCSQYLGIMHSLISPLELFAITY